MELIEFFSHNSRTSDDSFELFCEDLPDSDTKRACDKYCPNCPLCKESSNSKVYSCPKSPPTTTLPSAGGDDDGEEDIANILVIVLGIIVLVLVGAGISWCLYTHARRGTLHLSKKTISQNNRQFFIIWNMHNKCKLLIFFTVCYGD